jgi:tetratricopeptide (TPR) repeat protein
MFRWLTVLMAGLVWNVVIVPVSVAANGKSQALAVEAILPPSGLTTPGSKVTIEGEGFSSSSVVYFDGLRSRETKFINPRQLEAVTPYLRPGEHRIEVTSQGNSIRSSLAFSALPSEVDSQIDNAIELARDGSLDRSISILEDIAHRNTDYQVRSFAFFEESQIYLAHANWGQWGRGAASIYLNAQEAGQAIQTFWRYRLAFAQSSYYLDTRGEEGLDLRLADLVVKFDVTDNAEPHFYRGMLNARFGNLSSAKADVNFVLKADPENQSYQALGAYVAALSGDSNKLRAMSSRAAPTDASALMLMGEAFFLTGDVPNADRYWNLAHSAYPAGASLALMAAKKHLAKGQTAVAKVLFSECLAMGSNSKETQEAEEALSAL